MGLIADSLYNSFPGLKQAEEEAEKAIDCLKNSFELGKNIAGYVMDKNDEIIDNVKSGVGSYFSGLAKKLVNDFEDYKSPGNGSGRDKQSPDAASKSSPVNYPASPIILPPSSKHASQTSYNRPKTEESFYKEPESGCERPAKSKTKSKSLDDLIKNFKKELKSLDQDYDASIDVYERNSKIRSYKADMGNEGLDSELRDEPYTSGSCYLDSLVSGAGHDYIKGSLKAAELYNQGMNTYDIQKNIQKNMQKRTGSSNYNVRDYNDLTDKVALAISLGNDYTRGCYNNAVAEKLGVRDQIINDYLLGKSYKEIKSNLKKNTNGMSISDSSILRIMHNYEKKTGTKVVGMKRRGNRKQNQKIAS